MFRPYIPDEARLPEMTFRALVLGTLLGMVFGASSLYLVLKVGLTVSASIPVAVIAITFFGLAKKLGGKDASILENSIAQTAGSARESIAFGLGMVTPRPKAIDSPAEPAVCAMLFSRMLASLPPIFLARPKKVIAITATGIDALTVRPTLSTRYSEEAPNTMPSKVPRNSARKVISGSRASSGI